MYRIITEKRITDKVKMPGKHREGAKGKHMNEQNKLFHQMRYQT